MIDIHTHLQRATPEQLEELLLEARSRGVKVMVLAGQDPESSRAAVELASQKEALWACVGLHPWMVTPDGLASGEQTWEALRGLASQPKVVGFGEIGLDHSRCPAETWEAQSRALEEQLKLAAEMDLPAVLHNRGAHQEMLSILRSLPREKQPPGLALHGFSGGAGEARDYLESGVYLSFGKSLLGEEGRALREVVPEVPLGRLLLDSDASSQPGRPVPADLRDVAETIAELMGVKVEEVMAASERNARNFFPKMR